MKTTVTRTRITTVTTTTVGGQTTTVSTTTETDGDVDTSELDAAFDSFSSVGQRMGEEFSAAAKCVSEAAKRVHASVKKKTEPEK